MNKYVKNPSRVTAKAALLEIALEASLTLQKNNTTALNTTRQMFRDPSRGSARVVRGSTVRRRFDATAADSSVARVRRARAENVARTQRDARQSQAMRLRARLGCSPPRVFRRESEPVDLRLHLEEIVDRAVEVEDFGCVVDMFLVRPETPPYVPAKTGLDATTQIEPDDLWDYDLEVQPILEVLVGKTVEQALIEVIEEEEMEGILETQRRYREMRMAERVEKWRLIEQERRLREEKERRVKQHHRAVAVQKETEERVAAAVFAHGYIADLLPDVLEGLKRAGYLLEDIREAVETGFLPTLLQKIDCTLQDREIIHDVLTALVREIQEYRAGTYRRLGEEELPLQSALAKRVQTVSAPSSIQDPSYDYHTYIRNMGVEEPWLPPVKQQPLVKGVRL